MNFVYDAAERVFGFGELETLKRFVEERDANTEWTTGHFNENRFHPLMEEPLFAITYANDMGCSEQAVEDTMYGVGLTMKVDDKTIPVGETAVKTILDRAGLDAKGFKNLKNYNLNELANVLNLLAKANNQKATIKIADEKVRAVHSDRYAVLTPRKLLDICCEYFEENWSESEFHSGYFSHECFRFYFDLSAYKKQFFQKLAQNKYLSTATPALLIVSSDVARNAVTLIPSMVYGNSCVPLSWDKNIFVPHTGQDLEEKVANAFSRILAYFSDACDDILELDNIVIRNPLNALKRVFKENGMPKVSAVKAIEAFSTSFDLENETITALDIYSAVTDAYSFVLRDFAKDANKIFEAADCVARVTKVDWKSVDRADEVKY